ncbi:asparaginase [Lutimonas saemankumensis]|uniref:asparaginase n=1 Tax=Lutimonas saemankumensis TaxID=483016 RepID=UPI001CD57B68|nr:asparaginase [Lutimonas saemankumensis]MCA0933223.1 asparaginase [Lutimonas saemankumensis]
MEKRVPQILIIYTGGTIGMVKDYETNALKPFDFENLKTKIPELNLLECSLKTTAFEQPIDSSDMSPDHWINIAEIIESNHDQTDGFVVLTGTDTMSYTASAMSFILENLSKPVIFTGSQLPIGDLRTDAKENLITAIQVASAFENGEAVVQEVALYFEYKLYRANRTTKVSAEQFEAFQSPNYPNLGESGVHLIFNRQFLKRTKKDLPLKVQKNLDANVVILKLFPGIQRSMVEYILNYPDLHGVILETYGAGNAPTDSWFFEILIKTIQRGIPIVNVSQCISGGVLMGLYETSTKMKSIGVINGKNITTESAVAKLKLMLGLKIPYNEFKEKFETEIRGEMS